MGAVIVFSSAAIQALTVAEVAPAPETKVTVHDVGGAMAEPVGVAGFGMRPSPSEGARPCGSTGKLPASTGGVGWVMTSAAATL